MITDLSTGGAQRTLHNLLTCLNDKQIRSKVIVLKTEDGFGKQVRNLGVPVSALGMERGVPTVSNAKTLRNLVHVFCPDIIQGWMYHGNVAATLAQVIAPGKPRLVWNIRHSLYELRREKFLTRQIIRINRIMSDRPGVIVYNSHISRNQHQTFGFQSGSGLVIPNGFDALAFMPSQKQGKLVRMELGIPPQARVIGHMARLHPMKDHEGFINAAVRIGSYLKDVHVVLCGRGVTSDNESLRRLVPADMQQRFHWLGERNDVSRVLSTFDVFCLSSAWGEAFPNVLGEAMASSIPCVATDVGDSTDIIGDTGYVVPPKDEKALVDALVRILTMSSSERRNLGRSARARMREHYTLEGIAKEYERLYVRLVGSVQTARLSEKLGEKTK